MYYTSDYGDHWFDMNLSLDLASITKVQSVSHDGFHRWVITVNSGDIAYFDDNAGSLSWTRVATGSSSLSDAAVGQ